MFFHWAVFASTVMVKWAQGAANFLPTNQPKKKKGYLWAWSSGASMQGKCHRWAYFGSSGTETRVIPGSALCSRVKVQFVPMPWHLKYETQHEDFIFNCNRCFSTNSGWQMLIYGLDRLLHNILSYYYLISLKIQSILALTGWMGGGEVARWLE